MGKWRPNYGQIQGFKKEKKKKKTSIRQPSFYYFTLDVCHYSRTPGSSSIIDWIIIIIVVVVIVTVLFVSFYISLTLTVVSAVRGFHF